jgi:hypothetical protein
MEENMEKENFYWALSVCLSGKCNRNCSHCVVNADMKGVYFSKENAQLLANLVKEEGKVFARGNLHGQYDFTGNGELLMNPDLVEIFDILFSQSQSVGLLVTSGIDPKSKEEADRLKTILSREYASRLQFDVSFNLFERRFPKRLIKTLKLLFENGVREVGIKICQTKKRTLSSLAKAYDLIVPFFLRWAREVDPLASAELSFYNCNLTEGAKRMIEDLYLINNNPQSLQKVRPLTQADFDSEQVFFQATFCHTVAFQTRFGERRIKFIPHFLTKRGRAMNLDAESVPPGKEKDLCSFLTDKTKHGFHVGSDGHIYPNIECPNKDIFRLGDLTTPMDVVYGRLSGLRRKLFELIVTDKRMYTDMCEFCRMIADPYKWN